MTNTELPYEWSVEIEHPDEDGGWWTHPCTTIDGVVEQIRFAQVRGFRYVVHLITSVVFSTEPIQSTNDANIAAKIASLTQEALGRLKKE